MSKVLNQESLPESKRLEAMIEAKLDDWLPIQSSQCEKATQLKIEILDLAKQYHELTGNYYIRQSRGEQYDVD